MHGGCQLGVIRSFLELWRPAPPHHRTRSSHGNPNARRTDLSQKQQENSPQPANGRIESVTSHPAPGCASAPLIPDLFRASPQRYPGDFQTLCKSLPRLGVTVSVVWGRGPSVPALAFRSGWVTPTSIVASWLEIFMHSDVPKPCICQDGKEHIAPVASGKPTAETFKVGVRVL